MSFRDNYGKPISEKLSIYIRKNTGKTDWAEVAACQNVSPSTVRNMIRRESLLTDKNVDVLVEIMRRAVHNGRSNVQDFREATEYIDKEIEMAEMDKAISDH